jgi:hypothetical protein
VRRLRAGSTAQTRELRLLADLRKQDLPGFGQVTSVPPHRVTSVQLRERFGGDGDRRERFRQFARRLGVEPENLSQNDSQRHGFMTHALDRPGCIKGTERVGAAQTESPGCREVAARLYQRNRACWSPSQPRTRLRRHR